MTRILRPRRSLLFLPGSNPRTIEKARILPCDVILFDLEDAVSPENKIAAREKVLKAVTETDFGHREKVVRINSMNSQWGEPDAAAFADASIDAILLPKVESPEQVKKLTSITGKPIWCNIETPMGVLNAAAIASAHKQVEAFIAGTNDLSAELNIRRTPDRAGLLASLSHIVLVARAYGLSVFDGTFTDIPDTRGLLAEARQGRFLGFDGKTIIHPDHIEFVNEIFSPSQTEVEQAQRIVSTYTLAMHEHQAVVAFEGKMIEKLHYDAANRLLSLHEQISGRR